MRHQGFFWGTKRERTPLRRQNAERQQVVPVISAVMLTLRPNVFDTPDRRDVTVLQDGEEIGRIYQTHGDRWVWAIAGWGSKIADSLELAKLELEAQLSRNAK